MKNPHALSESELRDILDGMVEGIITINLKGIIITFNKSAEKIFGYSTEEVLGKNISMLMPEPDKSKHNDYLKRYKETKDPHIIGIGRNVTALRKNGEQFPLHLAVTEHPAKIENDKWFIGSCLDITLHKQQEDQLKRSSKMKAIGQLSSGISHDYNNILGVILGYSQLIADEINDNPQLQGYLEQIIHAVERGTQLTQGLLSFSGKDSESDEKTSINYLLENNFKMLEKTLTPNVHLEMELEKELWPVYVNSGCLEDAILNMSINAMHAMPEGGNLSYGTSNIEIGVTESRILGINIGDYVKLSITDTGIGMSEEVSAQIFTPFFTTKGEKGTGLGLSQVYNFVHNYGGTIQLKSAIGCGSCFSIYLPRYNENLSEEKCDKQQSIEKDDYTVNANILVVDDEESMLWLNKIILDSKGYNVITASSGKQALSILENNQVDLVLSDIVMSDMDGFELAFIIQNKFPKIKIQLCSGHFHNRGKSVTNDELAENVLRKPYSKNELLSKVQNALEK